MTEGAYYSESPHIKKDILGLLFYFAQEVDLLCDMSVSYVYHDAFIYV